MAAASHMCSFNQLKYFIYDFDAQVHKTVSEQSNCCTLKESKNVASHTACQNQYYFTEYLVILISKVLQSRTYFKITYLSRKLRPQSVFKITSDLYVQICQGLLHKVLPQYSGSHNSSVEIQFIALAVRSHSSRT